MNRLMTLAGLAVAGVVLAGCGLPNPTTDLPTCGSAEHISMQSFENDQVDEFITLKGGMVIPSGDKPLTVPRVVEPPENCTGTECEPVVCRVDCLPTPTCEDTNTCVTPTCEDTNTCVVPVDKCQMPITASDRAEDNSGKERCKDVGTNYETETDNRHDNSVKEDTDTENNPDGDEDDATDGETSTPPNDNPNAAFNR